MYLLDTNVVSELRPGKPKQSPEVRAWAASVPQSSIYVSSITILEQEMGVLRQERRMPPEGQALRRWATAIQERFADRVLVFDQKAAMLCAPMHIPDPKSIRDSMIAAIALMHGLVVVTRNTSDFSGISGIRLLNPWSHTDSTL